MKVSKRKFNFCFILKKQMLETHEIISFSYHDPSTDSLENVDVCTLD